MYENLGLFTSSLIIWSFAVSLNVYIKGPFSVIWFIYTVCEDGKHNILKPSFYEYLTVL